MGKRDKGGILPEKDGVCENGGGAIFCRSTLQAHGGRTYVAAGRQLASKTVLYVSTREPHPHLELRGRRQGVCPRHFFKRPYLFSFWGFNFGTDPSPTLTLARI